MYGSVRKCTADYGKYTEIAAKVVLSAGELMSVDYDKASLKSFFLVRSKLSVYVLHTCSKIVSRQQ